MKTILKVFIVAFIATSCSSDDDTGTAFELSKANLTGTWTQTKVTGSNGIENPVSCDGTTATLRFFEQGNAIGQVVDPSTPCSINEIDFKSYSIDANSITLLGAEPPTDPERVKFNVLEFSANNLVIEGVENDDTTQTYSR
ncbi:hypothetical protein [Aquimarina algiphila]|uniref:Lipocalin family protein n=1 Tax=Aquimarina algiphila TaxID=2047982 RepID=A0A554VRQ1_9FLAO|nr:hypothetical protein [Aquimarina algiphila]TSE11330.1 hypothetical protein FOF46_01490 [Aquimarina algiphila]